MKYSFIAVVLASFLLTACEPYKKHPMDKPPPSAMADRASAPNFDDLDKTDEAGAKNATGSAGTDDKKQEPGK
ncbi:MAG TPA: hypothetical protein VHB01_12370 [Nitrosospira sp.]|nr:hypothetical protein [Nitrosospira sp.]